MRSVNSLVLLTLLLAARRPSTPPPLFPNCPVIDGTPGVTFTRDAGETLAPTAQRLSGIAYTYGLATLDTPGTLLAWHRETLSITRDHGCSWTPVTTNNTFDFPPSIAAAPGDRAYIWSDAREFLLRYDERGVTALRAPGALIGLGVDPSNASRLRAGDTNGNLWHSDDAGDSWTSLGQVRVANGIPIFYRFAFDPASLDHVVVGTAVSGAYVTTDGGRNWTRATGLGTSSVNVFQVVVSPADGNVVWAMGLDLAQDRRHIYRSTDGGATYGAVVDASPSVTLINGPTMAADPHNRDVVYFVFGTSFQNYGTDLFRYDAGANRLTMTHNPNHGVNAIAFSRVQPNLMYLGLAVEQRSAP